MTALRSLDRRAWVALAVFVTALALLVSYWPAEAASRRTWRATCDGPVRIYLDGDGTVTATAVIGSKACEELR